MSTSRTHWTMAGVTIQPYPLVKAKLNRMGHLELWQADEDGSESLYLQSESDVSAVLDSLPHTERNELRNGYTVLTHFISDEYFQ